MSAVVQLHLPGAELQQEVLPKESKESGPLVTVPEKSAMVVFTDTEQMQRILDLVAQRARDFVADTSTAKGRKAIASQAYLVARTRTYLDGIGKGLVDGMKDLPRQIDQRRKLAREVLEKLQEDIRAPLDAWEQEQARIEAEKAAERARIEAEQAAMRAAAEAQERLERDWDMALLEDKVWTQAQAIEREAQERMAQLREQQAAERARQEEQQRAAAQVREAQEREKRERVAREQADQRAREAQERAQAEAAAAVQRERERAETAAAEQRRQDEARAADRAHRAKVCGEIIQDLQAVAGFGLTIEQTRTLTLALAAGQVRNVRVHF